ncbi:MAG: hypothetical protein ACOH5I_15470 [Oligoflexus sp.]
MKKHHHGTNAKTRRNLFLPSILSFAFIVSLFSSSAAFATQNHSHRYFQIEIGDGAGSKPGSIRERQYKKYDHHAHHHYNQPIRDRLRRLETAVRELQNEVWELRRENDYFKSQQHRYACYIQTPFDGTFLGRGTTRIEATALALNQCEAKAQSWCKEQRVKCEKA